MACQELLVNAKEALSNLEAAMIQLRNLETNLNQERVQLEQDRVRVNVDRQKVDKDRENFEAERTAMMKGGIAQGDLIGLNFRGEKQLMMKRSVLCQVEGSMLAAMFSGRYDDNLEHDKHGNVYISYPPAVMMPLMDCLTTCQDVPGGTQSPVIQIPKEYEKMWDGAVKYFGLESIEHPVVFSGVKRDIKMRDLKGWRMEMCKPCTEPTTSADFRLPGIPADSAVLVGIRKKGSDELAVAAIGHPNIIAQSDSWDVQHNGVYWGWDQHFFTFSDSPLDTFYLYVDTLFCREVAVSNRYLWACRATHIIDFEKVIMVPMVRVNFLKA